MTKDNWITLALSVLGIVVVGSYILQGDYYRAMVLGILLVILINTN